MRINEDTRPSEKHLLEINYLREIVERLQKEIIDNTQNAGNEQKRLINKIAELEENQFYIKKLEENQGFTKKSEEKQGIFDFTMKKDPEIQLSSLQLLLREKISILDEEIRKRVDAETKLRNVIMSESESEKKVEKISKELNEKIESLELELKSYQKDLQTSFEEREELISKYEQMTISLKDTTENLRRAEEEILALQQEQKSDSIKFTTKLQNSATNSVELKSKIKELNDTNDKLLKENQNLYGTLKTLEKENENSCLRLEDLQKTVFSMKTKIKDYEQEIENLEEKRTEDSNSYMINLENLKIELKGTYEEFEKTIERYDGQLGSLKEQYYNELKQQKNPKKAAEKVDFMLQISKKDSIIKSLKTELKSIKPKKLDKKLKKQDSPPKEEENIYLQNQVYKLRAQVRNLESQVLVSRDEIEKMSQELDTKPQSDTSSKKEILDIEKRHRLDMQKLAEEVSRLREKWHSPDE